MDFSQNWRIQDRCRYRKIYLECVTKFKKPFQAVTWKGSFHKTITYQYKNGKNKFKKQYFHA